MKKLLLPLVIFATRLEAQIYRGDNKTPNVTRDINYESSRESIIIKLDDWDGHDRAVAFLPGDTRRQSTKYFKTIGFLGKEFVTDSLTYRFIVRFSKQFFANTDTSNDWNNCYTVIVHKSVDDSGSYTIRNCVLRKRYFASLYDWIGKQHLDSAILDEFRGGYLSRTLR